MPKLGEMEPVNPKLVRDNWVTRPVDELLPLQTTPVHLHGLASVASQFERGWVEDCARFLLKVKRATMSGLFVDCPTATSSMAARCRHQYITEKLDLRFQRLDSIIFIDQVK